MHPLPRWIPARTANEAWGGMKTKTKSTAATAAPVAPAAGLKRINLAGISTKAPAAKAAKAYPLLPDADGQVAALVEGILEKSEQLEAIEGALEIEKAELIAIAKPFYFAHHAGQMAVASSIEARSGDQTIRVGFSNSYRGTSDDSAIVRAVGEEGARFFKQSFELKIKGDLIPEAAVEEVIGELQELFARHNAGAALSAKAVFKPNKDFHTARHTLFKPKQNLEIDSRAPWEGARQMPPVRHPAGGEGQGMSRVNMVPVSASVKTKLGRGGGEE